MSKERKRRWGDLSIEEKADSLGQEMDGVGKTLGIFERAIKELYERIEKIEKGGKMSKEKKNVWDDLGISGKVVLVGEEMDKMESVATILGKFGRAIVKLHERIEKLEAK